MKLTSNPTLAHRSKKELASLYMVLLAYRAVMDKHLTADERVVMERHESFNNRVDRLLYHAKEYADVVALANDIQRNSAIGPHVEDLELRELYERHNGDDLIDLLKQEVPKTDQVDVLETALAYLRAHIADPGDAFDVILKDLQDTLDDSRR